jgi:hypothetical protein
VTAVELRRDLCALNLTLAQFQGLHHVCSYVETPVVVYAPEATDLRHGNFLDASYQAILKRPEWTHRLKKVHIRSNVDDLRPAFW